MSTVVQMLIRLGVPLASMKSLIRVSPKGGTYVVLHAASVEARRIVEEARPVWYRVDGRVRVIFDNKPWDVTAEIDKMLGERKAA